MLTKIQNCHPKIWNKRLWNNYSRMSSICHQQGKCCEWGQQQLSVYKEQWQWFQLSHKHTHKTKNFYKRIELLSTYRSHNKGYWRPRRTHILQGTSRTSSTKPSRIMKQIDTNAALYSTSHCMNICARLSSIKI